MAAVNAIEIAERDNGAARLDRHFRVVPKQPHGVAVPAISMSSHERTIGAEDIALTTAWVARSPA
jgi:hypothetical protein